MRPPACALDLDAVKVEANDETGVLIVRRGAVTLIFDFSDTARDVAGGRVGGGVRRPGF